MRIPFLSVLNKIRLRQHINIHEKQCTYIYEKYCLKTNVYCTQLQHTATHCNTLQHTAAHCNTLQHTATHCNTLQHTATHRNTLQHSIQIQMRTRHQYVWEFHSQCIYLRDCFLMYVYTSSEPHAHSGMLRFIWGVRDALYEEFVTHSQCICIYLFWTPRTLRGASLYMRSSWRFIWGIRDSFTMHMYMTLLNRTHTQGCFALYEEFVTLYMRSSWLIHNAYTIVTHS